MAAQSRSSIYRQSICRNRFEKFVEILSAPIGVETVDNESADVVDNTSNFDDSIPSALRNDESLADASDFTADNLDATTQEEGTEQNVGNVRLLSLTNRS